MTIKLTNLFDDHQVFKLNKLRQKKHCVNSLTVYCNVTITMIMILVNAATSAVFFFFDLSSILTIQHDFLLIGIDSKKKIAIGINRSLYSVIIAANKMEIHACYF